MSKFNQKSIASSKSQRKSPPSMLHVSNLPASVKESDLEVLFSSVGPTRLIVVAVDNSGKSTAKVMFRHGEDAAKAKQLYQGKSLDGRPITIELAGETTVQRSTWKRDTSSSQKKGPTFKNRRYRPKLKSVKISKEALDEELELYMVEARATRAKNEELIMAMDDCDLN